MAMFKGDEPSDNEIGFGWEDLAYIDFPSRTIGFGKMITPSGDIEKDFEIIKDFYRDKTGKYPEKQGPVRIKKR